MPQKHNSNGQRLRSARSRHRLIPGFLKSNQAHALFLHLEKEIDWQPETLFLFGRKVETRRRSAYFSNDSLSYGYSGILHRPRRLLPEITELMERLSMEMAYTFNSSLANYYPDGLAGLGWHRDDEPELGPSPSVATLSLGATRRMDILHTASGETQSMDLDSGTLLIMEAGFQEEWIHRIARQPGVKAPRISLSFRQIDPSSQIRA